jgi:hypothetical protein
MPQISKWSIRPAYYLSVRFLVHNLAGHKSQAEFMTAGRSPKPPPPHLLFQSVVHVILAFPFPAPRTCYVFVSRIPHGTWWLHGNSPWALDSLLVVGVPGPADHTNPLPFPTAVTSLPTRATGYPHSPAPSPLPPPTTSLFVSSTETSPIDIPRLSIGNSSTQPHPSIHPPSLRPFL